jgi:hypothetical protein
LGTHKNSTDLLSWDNAVSVGDDNAPSQSLKKQRIFWSVLGATAMNIYSKLLVLCVFHPNLWETTAFVNPTPKALALNVAYAEPQKSADTSYTYLNEEVEGTKSPAPFGVRRGKITEMAIDLPKEKTAGGAMEVVKEMDVWEATSPVIVQGGSLRTWSFTTPVIKRVQVLLKSEGRPINANVELWQGPDNSPQKMMVYIEDGSIRPFSAVIETPKDHNAISVRNTGQMEFPLIAGVIADVGDGSEPEGLGAMIKALSEKKASKTIQGGAVHTYPFGPNVASVQIFLKTDGRPLNARLELLQGPNNNKQVVEVYTENGKERPFFMLIDTPGSGNVIRIVNTATVEFPMTGWVEPYLLDPGMAEGADVASYFILD